MYSLISIGLALFSIFMFVLMFLKGKENHLTKHMFAFREFPESHTPLKILFISDIHRRVISNKLLEQIPNSLDFVMIGGDLTESGVPFDRVEENLKILTKFAPAYFVFGNNDYEVGKEKLEELLKKHHVTILNNSWEKITSNAGATICIIGVEDMSEERDRLDIAVKDIPTNGFNILMSHNPEIIEKLPNNSRIQLILSGHQHGGQIRIFGLGLYEKGRVHFLRHSILLISNGYGTSGIPLRLGAPAEAHYIELTQK